jgi:hypothetical protein
MAPLDQTSIVVGEDLMEISLNGPQAAKSM